MPDSAFLPPPNVQTNLPQAFYRPVWYEAVHMDNLPRLIEKPPCLGAALSDLLYCYQFQAFTIFRALFVDKYSRIFLIPGHHYL